MNILIGSYLYLQSTNIFTYKTLPIIYNNKCKPKGWWFAHPNAFRFRRFYREETNGQFISRVDKLYTIFLALCSTSQRRLGIVGERVNPQLSFDEYFDVLRKGGLLTGKSGISLGMNNKSSTTI